MRTIIVALALVAIFALPAAAGASSNPLRTEKQATDYIGKRVDSGTYLCYGRNGNGTDLYRSFTCVVKNFDRDSSTAYRLDTRPHGKWMVRVLR